MKNNRSTRTIDVWQRGPVKIEREGKTLSIQAITNGQVMAMVLPVDVAAILYEVLLDATAIPGETVVVVPRPEPPGQPDHIGEHGE